jgi:hypothetical protein
MKNAETRTVLRGAVEVVEFGDPLWRSKVHGFEARFAFGDPTVVEECRALNEEAAESAPLRLELPPEAIEELQQLAEHEGRTLDDVASDFVRILLAPPGLRTRLEEEERTGGASFPDYLRKLLAVVRSVQDEI